MNILNVFLTARHMVKKPFTSAHSSSDSQQGGVPFNPTLICWLAKENTCSAGNFRLLLHPPQTMDTILYSCGLGCYRGELGLFYEGHAGLGDLSGPF